MAVQPIEGGSLLKSLLDKLFSGVDKILDYEAQYEEEMGVLKRVTRVPILDDKTGDQVGSLTIKLSPVRDKDSYFYVEAETDVSGLDVSSLNGQVVRLNNNSMKSFNKMIDDLLSKNGNKPAEENNDESDSNSNTEDEENNDEPQNTDMNRDSHFAELEESYEREAEVSPRLVKADGALATVQATLKYNSHDPYFTVTIFVSGIDGKKIAKYKEEPVQINAFDNKGKQVPANTFIGRVNQAIDDYIVNNNLEETSGRVRSSIDVTLNKSAKDNEVSLVAINASSDINVDILSDLVSDDEFVNMLPANEDVSYRITDEGDDYDVEPIDTVDTASTYKLIYERICAIHNAYQSLGWALGVEWNEVRYSVRDIQYQLQCLVSTAARWVIIHDNVFPTPIQCAPTYESYDSLKASSDNSSLRLDVDKVASYLLSETASLIEWLDWVKVNLLSDEQVAIDQFIGPCRQAIAQI